MRRHHDLRLLNTLLGALHKTISFFTIDTALVGHIAAFIIQAHTFDARRNPFPGGYFLWQHRQFASLRFQSDVPIVPVSPVHAPVPPSVLRLYASTQNQTSDPRTDSPAARRDTR